MKNRTVIILLSVLAVALYTVAVINFCMGNVLSGIVDVLMASSDALMVWSLVMMGRVGRLSSITAKRLAEFMEQLTKGVPATLTVKDGKGTVTLGHDEDDDRDPGEAPEEELSDEEKRKMLEEIARLNEENAKLTAERDREAEQAKAFASHVTHDMKWLPTVEQIKSVYASAGVMEQMHEPTDAKHLMSLWEDLKLIHSANTDANVAAGKAEDPDDE